MCKNPGVLSVDIPNSAHALRPRGDPQTGTCSRCGRRCASRRRSGCCCRCRRSRRGPGGRGCRRSRRGPGGRGCGGCCSGSRRCAGGRDGGCSCSCSRRGPGRRSCRYRFYCRDIFRQTRPKLRFDRRTVNERQGKSHRTHEEQQHSFHKISGFSKGRHRMTNNLETANLQAPLVWGAQKLVCPQKKFSKATRRHPEKALDIPKNKSVPGFFKQVNKNGWADGEEEEERAS